MDPIPGLHHVTAVTRDAQHNVDFYRNGSSRMAGQSNRVWHPLFWSHLKKYSNVGQCEDEDEMLIVMSVEQLLRKSQSIQGLAFSIIALDKCKTNSYGIGVSGTGVSGTGVSVSGGTGVSVSGGIGVSVSGGIGVSVSGGTGVSVSGGIGVSVSGGTVGVLIVGTAVVAPGRGVAVGPGRAVAVATGVKVKVALAWSASRVLTERILAAIRVAVAGFRGVIVSKAPVSGIAAENAQRNPIFSAAVFGSALSR